jgi:drug/metabolite transporter (DMT)-like permease
MKENIDLKTGIAIAVTILFWSSAFAAIRAGLTGYNPGQMALFRFLVASVVLAVYAVITRMPLPDWRDLPVLSVMGILGFSIYHSVLNYGEKTVSAGAASFIINLSPLFIALLATVFLRERLNKLGWSGFTISFAGTTLLALGEGKGMHFNAGSVLILICALCISILFVMEKPYLKKYDPFALTTYTIWLGTLFLLVFAPGLLASIRTAPLDATLSVIYMGIFPGAVAYASWSYVLSRIPAAHASSFQYLTTPLAVLIALVWLHEVPSPLSLLGGAITLVGVVLVSQGNAAISAEDADIKQEPAHERL